MTPRVVVAIPVRDEEERIGACLEALARQRGAACDGVVLLLNNCTDRTAEVARACGATWHLPLLVEERCFPPALAHAGTARSAAMALAAELAGPDGLLLTTDADGVAEPDWVARTLEAVARGAEVVCGRAILSPQEAAMVPRHLHDDDEIECFYGRLLDEIHHRLDPDIHDPWPRHTEHSGASIAVTTAAWSRAGGVPPLPSGEDRAFLQALRRVDARVRHAPDVAVAVSARMVGRAAGGMAETIARRIVQQDPFVDDSLEPVALCVLRARLRASLRLLWVVSEPRARRRFADEAGLPAADIERHLASRYFGAAWEAVQAASPHLVRMPVARADLARMIAEAQEFLAGAPLHREAEDALSCALD